MAIAAPRLAAADSATVADYHGSPDRSGRYIVPGLTWTTAHTAHLTPTFKGGGFVGYAPAQPLYWHQAGAPHGRIIVATDQDMVQAIDAGTGQSIWSTMLGRDVPGPAVACGGKKPWGVDGTPVIDDTAGVVYLDAFETDASDAIQHMIYGVSLTNGSVLRGWPVNVAAALAAQGMPFTPMTQDERGALALLNGTLYVPYGGNGGDCGIYHGWVVGLNVAKPGVIGAWHSTAQGGSAWSPGGVTSDGTSLFITTGNSFNTSTWGDGEAVIRLPASLQHSTNTQDSFTPANWQTLDQSDLDLGATGPLPINVPVAGGGSANWLLALGKDGNAYVLDRGNLGGVGGNLLVQHVANSKIRTAPAVYTAADGVYVAFNGVGADCPSTAAVTVIKVMAQPAPSVRVAWCASFVSRGNPIVTTSDGVNNPIVWMVGAEGDQMLHGFNMLTGQALFTGGDIKISGAARFSTVLAAEGRLFVAGGGKLYSFSFGP